VSNLTAGFLQCDEAMDWLEKALLMRNRIQLKESTAIKSMEHFCTRAT
jgi:hypothetical protein